MPVSKKSLDKIGVRVDVRTYGIVQQRILDYLKDHAKQAFTQGELAKALSLTDQAVYRRLKVLVKRNIVGKFEHPMEKEYTDKAGNTHKRTWIAIVYQFEGNVDK